MKDLETLQREIGEWSKKTFGDNISKVTGLPMYSQNALTGLVEEVGELNHVTICRHQGRRGYDDIGKYVTDRNDAAADAMIFLLDYASRESFSLLQVLNDTWDKVVSKRTIENWEEIRHDVTTTLADTVVDPNSVPFNLETVKQAGETLLAHGKPSCKRCGAYESALRHPLVDGICADCDYLETKSGNRSTSVVQTGQGFAEPPEEVEEKLLTAHQWQLDTGIQIHDWDGWRTDDAPNSDVPISRVEFLFRASRSTIKFPKDKQNNKAILEEMNQACLEWAKSKS